MNVSAPAGQAGFDGMGIKFTHALAIPAYGGIHKEKLGDLLYMRCADYAISVAAGVYISLLY